MATHENVLTEAVGLCTPDGLRLNPAALGWSRHLLHRANLERQFGSSTGTSVATITCRPRVAEDAGSIAK